MEVFCGFLGYQGKVVENEQLEKIIANQGSGLNPNFYHFSYANFSLGVLYPKDNPPPRTIETSRYFFFASGRFDNTDFIRLFSQDDQILDKIFSLEFSTVLQNIRGDFVLILFDKKSCQLVCVRDQIGVRPFYYIEHNRFLCFSSEIKVFRKVPEVSFNVDNQWIADSLSLIQSEKYRTPYLGIRKLPPGNLLIANSKISVSPYWSVNSIENHADISYERAVQIFSEKLEQAVKRRINGCRVFGSELSGGLDSSGVTALAFKNMLPSKQSFFALSHTLGIENQHAHFPYKDELEYSQALTDSLGIQKHILIPGIGSGIVDSIKHSLVIQSGPSQQGFHFYSDLLLDKAKQHNVERLLSGFGGDEGVSSKASGYFNELRMTGSRSSFRNELYKYYERKGIGEFPALLRCEYKYFLGPLLERLKLSEAKRRQKGADLVLDSIDPQFFASMDILKRFKKKYVFPDEDTVLERQIRRVSHDHISQRLEYSYLTGKSYGIEYAYPLWDIDLLQFYISLPSAFKFRNGIGRSIFRESLFKVVPDQIRLRDDKSGFTIPSVFSRILTDHDRIKNLILRCKNQNGYHYLDYSVMLRWLESIKRKTLGMKGGQAKPEAFLNAIQILILQDMERSGEFYTGIRV